jgi:16S rRNA (adenine1518-N6/adenine1519-N6)-dimethyltransferase
LRPDKSLGQNFLIDPHALEQVVDIAQVEPEITVLEVGAGLGSLTRLLAGRAQRVIAVELDNDLVPILQEVLADFINVEVVQGDILDLDPGFLLRKSNAEPVDRGGEAPPPYIVVANIPYYITSALIRHLLETRERPERLTLTVQDEVAERICAVPDDMSLLALSVQVYGTPRVAARIPAGAFFPTPKVDSAVVRIDIHPIPLIASPQLPLFFRLARAGFSQRRKTLRNALAGGMGWQSERAGALLETAQINPQRRAETVSLDEWRRLVQVASSEEYHR